MKRNEKPGENNQPSRFQTWDRKRKRQQCERKQESSDSQADSPSDSEGDTPVSSPQRSNHNFRGNGDSDSFTDESEVEDQPNSRAHSHAGSLEEENRTSNHDNSDSNNTSDTSDNGQAGNLEVRNLNQQSESEWEDENGEQEQNHFENEDWGLNNPNDIVAGGDREQNEEAAEANVSNLSESEDGEVFDSEEGLSADEDQDEPVRDNQPLYEGALITFRQSLIAIITFALVHKLTGVCLADLLSLIKLHCGPNNICLKSLHKLREYFSMVGRKVITCHYFCSVCEVQLENKDSVCLTCKGINKTSYFIEFPIVKQLQIMYMRPEFVESLRFKFNRTKKNQNNLEDIYDGKIYKDQMDNGFLMNPNNVSFFLYFDGVSLYKSSKFSIWPLYLSINELKYKDRTKKENIVLAGIWFGKSKPNPNLFLKPLQEQISVLQTEGADFKLPNNETIRVKAKIIGAVADMPAKALFMRLTQFNGFHSCFNCTSTGGRYDLGNSSIQVYPYSRNFEMRRNEDMPNFAEQAVIARQRDPEASVYGVRGPTVLYTLLPDMINCMAQDIMHGTFLGIMRTLMHLWFDSEHSNSPFSISALVGVVDKRLENIKPPFSFQRVPRSISKELNLFKALDFKLFMMFYSLPVLYGILPDEYWAHHCKIVSAISLLNQQSVSLEQVDIAEDLLHSYVKDFERLYSLRYVGLNVHQLLHLGCITRNLGPTWVYSCFFYESLNGEFTRLVHGTRHAALQICSSSSVFMNLAVMINSMNDECDAKILCSKLLSAGKLKLKINEMIDQQTHVVGNYKKCTPVSQQLIRLLRTMNIIGGRCQYFFRLQKKGVIYCSIDYVRSKQKLSCFVEILHEGIPYLCKINSFIKWSSCGIDCPKVCNNCPCRFFCILTKYERILWALHETRTNLAYLDRVIPLNEYCIFSVDVISKPCLYMSINEDEYLAVPVNTLEIE